MFFRENKCFYATFHDDDCCGGDYCDYTREDKRFFNGILFGEKKRFMPLLSIGQMIEFLQNKEVTTHFVDDSYDHVVGWSFSDSMEGFPFAVAWSKHEELCDALWDACKSILEEK